MKNTIYTIRMLAVILSLFFFLNSVFSQDGFDDPKNFKYFKILANSKDDPVFLDVQRAMGVESAMESYTLVVNITSKEASDNYICIGDETDPTKIQIEWSSIPADMQTKILNWNRENKTDLTHKTYTSFSPLFEPADRIKFGSAFKPTQRLHQVAGKYNYINSYFQLFGGERLGVPLKGSLGTTFGTGTKYSGPFESDQISAGLNIFGISVNYITRLRGLNTHTIDKDGEASSFWQQYNNVYSPPNAWEINVTFPFGNFFEAGYYKPFGDVKKGGPEYIIYENGDSSRPMPNNIIEGGYFNFEIRYPFRFFDGVKSQFYAAYYLKEAHIGFFTRESRIAGSVFDLRIDYTASNIRNNQFQFEILISNLWESFGLASLAVGPSVRVTKLDTGNIGLHTFFLNARFKLGDFYTEK